MKVLENVRNVVIHSFGEKQQKQANFIEDAQILMVDVGIMKGVIDLFIITVPYIFILYP